MPSGWVRQSPQAVTATVVNGKLTVTLRAQPYPRRIRQIRITGPSGSAFALYLGSLSQQPFDNTNRGDTNQEDYSNPVEIPAGYAVYGQWNTGAGAATATFLLDRWA